MGAFDPVAFDWGGQPVVISADRVLGAIARLEEHVSFSDLTAMGLGAPIQFGAFARAVGTVLRYGGVPVDDEAVYLALLTDPAAKLAAQEGLEALVDAFSPVTTIKGEAGAGGSGTGGGIVLAFFKAAVGNSWVSRAEFWTLTPWELWALLDAKRPPKMYGHMTEAEVERLYAEAYGDEEDPA